MRLDQLVTFRCVADERSYTRAAEHLYVTQSAVYQQVRHLEQEIGAKLCYVHGKEVLLTAAGRAVHAFALTVGEHHELLQRQLRDLRGADEQVVRIAAASYFGMLPAAAERLAGRHPGIMIEFRSLAPTEAIDRIRAREIDFAFFGSVYVPGDLHAEPCYEQRLVIAVPAEHELAACESLRFAEIQHERFIGYLGGSARAAIDAWKRTRPEIEIHYRALGDSSPAIKAMAMSMHIPAIIAEAAIEEEVQSGRMKILNVEDFATEYTLYVVHRAVETLSPAAAAYLREILGVDDFPRTHAPVAAAQTAVTPL